MILIENKNTNEEEQQEQESDIYSYVGIIHNIISKLEDLIIVIESMNRN